MTSRNIPLESKDGDGSLSHRKPLSLKKKSPLSQNLRRRLKKNWGISLTVISKTGTIRQKLGITNQKNEVAKNPQQHEKCCKNGCLATNPTCVNHHQKCRSRLIWSSNAQLTELRIEEHHEERVGTNIL